MVPSIKKYNGSTRSQPVDACAPISLLVINPNTPRQNPSPMLPTSPRKIRALGKLNGRNPNIAPVIIQLMTVTIPSDPPVNSATPSAVKATCPATRPLIPSMKLIKFINATNPKTKTAIVSPDHSPEPKAQTTPAAAANCANNRHFTAIPRRSSQRLMALSRINPINHTPPTVARLG